MENLLEEQQDNPFYQERFLHLSKCTKTQQEFDGATFFSNGLKLKAALDFGKHNLELWNDFSNQS